MYMYICLYNICAYFIFSLPLSLYPFQANQSLDDLVPLLEDPCNIQVSHVLYLAITYLYCIHL